METYLLGEAPSLTRLQVAEQAGVAPEVAAELWRLMGFPTPTDDAVAFTPLDVQALRHTRDLIDLGILGPDRQAALVRTWGRSYARLAEWQTALLTSRALESDAEPADTLAQLTQEVLPRVDALQSYVWRRHLASAGSRMLAVEAPGSPVVRQAVVFVDIVGYTSRSKSLSEAELVDWLEHFESETLGLVVDRGGRIIKNIGDEVLVVADDVTAAAEIALTMTARGSDEADRFPEVRAGIAYGPVVTRLGDVFGPTVNIASRLTSLARPGTVVVDQGAYERLSGRVHDAEGDRDATDRETESDSGAAPYAFRRMRRVSVKGYSRLQAWALRRPRSRATQDG
ncbi:adenylate/guanylate cyclase domain-containing protein [Nocardioides sp.]|uniref:adenylate/guanylate cyclase domain-containing protein n=1 Tax=Nocardioides sp. TaxID=35761 RepID=UPI00286B1109|nr:adenylate/guanylate cyclase domain-containing protein [Nocardioides sp.]